MMDATTLQSATAIAYTGVIIAAAVAATLAIVRIVKGPTDTDRIIALDILFSAALGMGLVASLLTGRTVFIDVGLGLSLVGFVGTIGWARLIRLGALAEEEQRHTP